MLKTKLASLLIAAMVSLGGAQCRAQTIYPIDNADILAGSRFDLKVEVLATDAAGLKLTINGQDAAALTKVTLETVANEEGQPHTAFWLRNVVLSTPGTYEVAAATPSGTSTVTWNVYATPPRKARNVILFIGDGMSVAHRTAARILSKGIRQGKFAGELAIDDMPHMALVSTAGTDSVITDSANSMSAYTTGHKTCVNAIGVYCARNVDPLAHPRVENLTSLAQRRGGLAVGVVTNSEITDATPAGMVAHTRRRSEMNAIASMLFDAKPDVILGGGSAYFLPKPAGGKRTDETDLVSRFKDAGYAFADTAAQLRDNAGGESTRKLLGLFNVGDIDGALDLKYVKKGTVSKNPDQPDLVEETKAALQVLSRADNGFLLMVESSRIDKYSHALDWERAVYDTIMLDDAVKLAKDFAAQRNDTLIVVVPDHAHPISIVGTFDDNRPGDTPRTKLGVYDQAGYPNYPAPDAEGYPPTPDVSKRLAVLFGAYPDHCFSGKPSMDGAAVVPNPAPEVGLNCRPGTVKLFGNLPFDAPQGVHAGDDVVLTAMGPGSEIFHGHIDNTFVFRAIAEALDLGGCGGTQTCGAP